MNGEQVQAIKLNTVTIDFDIDDKVYYIKGKNVIEEVITGFNISKTKGGILKVIYKLGAMNKGKDSSRVYRTKEDARKAYFGHDE